MTHTNRMDVDVSSLRPTRGYVIIALDDEEMLRVGNTNLVLGYFDENRNNMHWFGTVVARAADAPVGVGDRVWFSFLSARGSDRIVSHGKAYLVMKHSYLILKQGDGLEMLNGCMLCVDAPKERSTIIHYECTDDYLSLVRHAPRDSVFKEGDVVLYFSKLVFELEGQRKLLGENFRVLREREVMGTIVSGEVVPTKGYVMVEAEPVKAKGSIIVPDTVRVERTNNGRVVGSGVDGIPVGSTIHFKRSRGTKYRDYFFVQHDNIEAVCV